MAADEKLEDAVYERTGALFERLSISELAYPRILKLAIKHAVTAPAPATDPTWVSVGPRNVGGRIQSLAQHPDAADTIFAGSAHGGVWRSIDRGDTWERIGSPEFVFPVGALAIPERAPTILYVGTGSPLKDYVSGQGLFRVLLDGINGKATFEPLAGVPDERLPPATVKDGSAFRYTRIRVDPDDATRFWAASQTGLWRCEVATAPGSLPKVTRELPDEKNKPDDAKLVDDFSGGINWPAHATDILVARDPRSDEEVDVTEDGKTRKARRYLILYAGINGKGVWRGRFDRKTGKTDFESSPLNVPDGGFGAFTRVRIALCARKPANVFVVFADSNDKPSEVFRSSNNGDSWKKGATRIPQSTQAEYDLVLECSPDDPSVLVCGAVELGLSVDGGDNWAHILDSTKRDKGDEAQHADQHIAMFDVADNRRLWVGNDGGLSLAHDLRAATQSPRYWRKRSHGIFAGQFQDISGSPFYPFVSGGGLQDNGSWVSYGGLTWYYVDGGDGGMMAIDHADPHQLFSTWQGSNAHNLGIDLGSAVPFDIASSSASDAIRLSLADLPESIAPGGLMDFQTVDISSGNPDSLFVGVIEQHPTIAGELLIGRNGDAYGSVNRGTAWAGLLGGAGIAANEEVRAVAFGPIDANAVPAGTDGWAGTDAGNLFVTPAASSGAWAAAPTPPWPGGNAQDVTRVIAHPNDRRVVVVCSGGTPGRVFISHDRGTTWVDITEPIPTGIAIVAPAGDLQVGHTRQFIATATYADASKRTVTADVTWTTSAAASATVGDTDVDKGHVTGVAPGSPTITATWTIGVTPALTATQVVKVVKKTSDPPAVPAPPVRETHRNALPPCPITSAIFDPSAAPGTPQRILVGTLAGVFILPAVPSITSLALTPPGPITLQTGAAAIPIKCIATFSDGTTRDVTANVDWSITGGAGPSVSNTAPNHGHLTAGGSLGAFNVQAARGTIPPATLAFNVQAPAAPAPPAPGPLPPATPPPVPIAWRPFGQRLPLALVNDLTRMGSANRIRAATFGLGVFECDMGPQTTNLLFIRQTVIDDGRVIPRAIPTVPAAGVVMPPPPPPPVALNDPRLPQAGPRSVPLDFTHAFDIRVDAPPYSFFDDVLDGVEFDEQLRPDDPVPTEINYVYVQVQNAGVEPVGPVTLHLYASECDPIPAIGTSPPTLNCPATLDAAAPIADFYGQPNFDPIGGSKWTRVDAAKTIDIISPGIPVVTRFTWIPDAALGTGAKFAALLALCSGPDATHDALPSPAAGATVSTLIVGERRAALRIVHVGTTPDPSIYVRDGVADDTRLGGYPVGGRSPDIMVVHPDISGTPIDAFKDFISRRPTDTVSGTGTNIIYVRLHNRRRFDTKAKVKVFAIDLDDSNRPSTDPALWTELPAGAAFSDVTVPSLGVGYARIEFPNATDPNVAGTNKTYLLLALVKSENDVDPLPSKGSVDSADEFWNLVSKYVDSDNAAARAVPWAP